MKKMPLGAHSADAREKEASCSSKEEQKEGNQPLHENACELCVHLIAAYMASISLLNVFSQCK